MFGPVPLTLQVLFVLLAGLVLGARLGALSVVAYLLVGLVPIYAFGASWLAWQLHASTLGPILWTSVVQFVPADVVKAALAALTARALVSLPLGLRALSRSR